MKFEIPKPMKIEHDELHADLVNATKAGGQTGEAAKAVAKVLHNHFVKEEEYALPPLGLLVALSEGKFETGMADVLKMTDKLEAELPTMLSEHKDIVAALTKLIEAARTENKPDVVHFAEKLMLHAQTEEQVAYPTALLIGRYVKTKTCCQIALAQEHALTIVSPLYPRKWTFVRRSEMSAKCQKRTFAHCPLTPFCS